MAKFRLKATCCKFEDSGTRGIGRTMSFLMFSDDIGTPIVVEAVNGAELTAAMEAYSKEIGDLTPRSFFVTEFLLRGERAFSGFRKKEWTVKVDRDARAKALETVGGL